MADASGQLFEMETALPDLASRLKERYMASRPPPPPQPAAGAEVTRSSPSVRRLRALLGGSSHGSGNPTVPNSPASPGGTSLFQKTRSLAARAGFGADTAAAAAAAAAAGGGLPPPPPCGINRRGSGLMGLLAVASVKWGSGTGLGGSGGSAGGASGGAPAVLSSPTVPQRSSLDPAEAPATGAADAMESAGAGAPPAAAAPAAAAALFSSTGSVAAPSTPVVAPPPPTPVGGAAADFASAGAAAAAAADPSVLVPALGPAAVVAGAAPATPRGGLQQPGTSPLRHRTAADDPIPERRSPVWAAAGTAGAVELATVVTAEAADERV